MRMNGRNIERCAGGRSQSVQSERPRYNTSHPNVSHQTILILDFGSQFTQLIARRLRELSVYCEILPFHTPIDVLRARQPVGIILSGGPKSVSEDGRAEVGPGCVGRWARPSSASATACS